MAQKHTIEQLKLRKHILEERTDRENQSIINKIDRNITRLSREKKYQDIFKKIKIVKVDLMTDDGEIFESFSDLDSCIDTVLTMTMEKE